MFASCEADSDLVLLSIPSPQAGQTFQKKPDGSGDSETACRGISPLLRKFSADGRHRFLQEGREAENVPSLRCICQIIL